MESISARRATKYPANTPPAATNVLHPSSQCPAGSFVIKLKVTVRYFWGGPKFMIPFYKFDWSSLPCNWSIAVKIWDLSQRYLTVFNYFYTTILSSWIFE